MKKNQFLVLTYSAIATLFSFAAHGQPVVKAGVLADPAGRTVYTFDKDTPGKSNCNASCLTAWPAFTAKAGATAQGDFGLIDANGARQWTVKGMPLYYFVGDSQPGDKNGDGSGGVWRVVSPGAAGGVATPGAAKY